MLKVGRNNRLWGAVRSLESLQPYANPRNGYPAVYICSFSLSEDPVISSSPNKINNCMVLEFLMCSMVLDKLFPLEFLLMYCSSLSQLPNPLWIPTFCKTCCQTCLVMLHSANDSFPFLPSIVGTPHQFPFPELKSIFIRKPV
ncbi:hypothetical protein V6N12_058544 [Hibiscus sabdariffa]|uniref:Uncharacterized protein n=1 Tax=Hibiscus sabdariffa TaxID=183260 RepID=A0ABR2ESF9_9ROSI